MAYTKLGWVNDQAPALNQTNLNHMDQGIYDAHQELAEYEDIFTGDLDDLSDDLSDVKSAFDDTFDYLFTETLENGFDKDNLETTNGYWSNSDGSFVSNSNYKACSAYARVKPNTKYSSWYNDGTASLYTYVCFYDASKNFIEGSALTSSNIITSPANAMYVRVSCVNARVSSYVLCEGETYSAYKTFGTKVVATKYAHVVPWNYETDKKLKDEGNIADAKGTGNIFKGIKDTSKLILLNGFDNTSLETGKRYDTADGTTLVDASTYSACTKYSFVCPGKTYSAWHKNTSNIFEASTYFYIYWYDGCQNFISGEVISSSNVVTAPDGAWYVRLAVLTTRKESFIFTEGSALAQYYTYGYSVGNTSNFLTINDLSYFTKEMLIEGIVTNGDVTPSPSGEYWFSLRNIIIAPFPVTINIKNGWRAHLFYYVGNTQTSPTTEWYIYDPYTIPANTPFSFYYQKTDASSATLSEAREAITIIGYTVNQYISDGMEPMYYYMGERLPLKKNGVVPVYKYIIVYESLPTGGLQGCDLNNNVLFVCRGDDILMLYDYDDGSEIANLESPVGHGNAFQFGNTKYDEADEFPVAYASPFFDTEDNDYSIVNKIRVSRSASSLIARYKFPVSSSGYYGAGCINEDDTIMYVVGFKAKSYTDGTGNALIVSEWDMTNLEQNEDSSYTPTFIRKFEIPFRMMMQGVKYINGRIICCHAPFTTSDNTTVFHSTIFVVDTVKERVVSEFKQLPITISGAELEDCFFVPYKNGYKLGVLMSNGRTQELVFDT